MHTYITHCHQSYKIKIDEFFLPMKKRIKLKFPAHERCHIGARLQSRPRQISAVRHDVSMECNIQVRLNLSEKPTLKCASLEWSMMAEMYLLVNRGQSSCFDLTVGLLFHLPSDTWNRHKEVDKHYGNLSKKIGCPSFLSQSAFIVAVNVN